MRPFAAGVLAVLICVSAAAATLQLPATINAEASGPGGAVVAFTVTANGTGTGDDFNGRPANGAPAVTCSPASGSVFGLGTTTVSCSASDSEGTATGSFEVVVRDTTGPALSLPGDLSAQATHQNGAAVSYNATAHDLVDGERAVTCTPPPGLFPVGSTVVTCTASDSAGNQASGSFTVTVGAPPPATPPVLQLPDDITVEAGGPAGAVVSFTVRASGSGFDDENGRPLNGSSTTCSPASGSTFALGATTVQCTATSSGGSTSGSFTVTVVDTTAPELRLPRSLTAQATSNDGATVTFDASAVDLVDGAVAVTCSPSSGSLFAIGTTAVTCSAADTRGNNASGSFDVTVTPPDATPPPVIDVPDDITAEADGPGGAIVTYTVTATGTGTGDDENGRPNGSGVTCTPASASLFPLGSTTVQCTAGAASATFLVHVIDTTAPALSLPADITTGQPVVTFDATATDLVSGSVAVTCAPPSGSTFAIGTTTVDCSAADAAGNSASGSFNVTVTQAPGRTITVKASPDKLWPPDKKFVPVTITVTVSDDSAFTAQIIAVRSSENDPNDNTTPDWNVTGPLTVDLRAEKSEQAQTRIYTVDVEVIDVDAVRHVRSVTVTVTNDGATSSATRVLKGKKGRKSRSSGAPTRSPRGRW